MNYIGMLFKSSGKTNSGNTGSAFPTAHQPTASGARRSGRFQCSRRPGCIDYFQTPKRGEGAPADYAIEKPSGCAHIVQGANLMLDLGLALWDATSKSLAMTN
jgi:hypothetical protein